MCCLAILEPYRHKDLNSIARPTLRKLKSWVRFDRGAGEAETGASSLLSEFQACERLSEEKEGVVVAHAFSPSSGGRSRRITVSSKLVRDIQRDPVLKSHKQPNKKQRK